MKDEILDVFITFFFASGFLVPGFILHRTVCHFVVQRTEDIQIFVLRFLTYTLLLYLVILPHVYWIYTSRYYQRHPFWTADIAILLLFVTPVVFGIAIGMALQWYKKSADFFREQLKKTGNYLLGHEHTAWDYLFCRLTEGNDKNGAVVVFANMKDGSRIVGVYGGNSFASEASENADIYLERLYEDTGSNDLVPVFNTKGILLKNGEIASLEFRSIYRPVEETPKNGRTRQVDARPATDRPRGNPEELDTCDGQSTTGAG